MTNLKEFKELIKKYESFTLKDIKETWERNDRSCYLISSGGVVMEFLTGFGNSFTCSLCRPINVNCSLCLWGVGPNIAGCDNANYREIYTSSTPEKLFELLQGRIILMKNKL